MSFHKFAKAVNARLVQLSKGELYRTNIDPDMLYAEYLRAFPDGTNPIYRERTEHDCSCCRNFIKNFGTLVAIVDGKMESIWNVVADHPYTDVTHALYFMMEDAQITGVYRTQEKSYGAEHSFEQTPTGVHKWNHFWGAVDAKHFNKEAATVAGKLNQDAQVFLRGLKELTPEAVKTVQELIAGKAIYRGEEFTKAVNDFAKLQNAYLKNPTDLFAWGNFDKPAARIKNTAIGSLLEDLSSGVELEKAVKAFEFKVAPTNYKRTTALITPSMIRVGLAKLKQLGLESAIQRRFAVMGDVSVTDILWVDGTAKQLMKNPLETALLGSKMIAKAPVKLNQVTEMSIDQFLANVVPSAEKMEIFLKNNMSTNLMSLTAPQDPEAEQLFQWKNNFGWSYNGNITDSIKEKVKRAGGNTDAKLRVSLSWFNADDLDLHCVAPNGQHIYFGNKMGILDVDTNGMGPRNDIDPVENLSWKSPSNGTYRVTVHQYSRRTNNNPGFVMEMEIDGKLSQYAYEKAVAPSDQIEVFTFKMTNGVMSDMVVSPRLTGSTVSQDVWGLKTEQFIPVQTMMLSPNHWDDQTQGNKHYFFIMEGCKNPEPTRGIYNEFLRNDLNEHRKVFEVLGAQTMCPVSDDQISGLGFSSTRSDQVTVRVTSGTKQQTYTVNF